MTGKRARGRRLVAGLVFLASLLCAMAGPAVAQGASAQAFVEAIYKPYLNKDFKGIPYATEASLRGYFEPKLAAAISKDMATAAKRKEVPKLDGDPFIDAQDWEISNMSINVRSTGDKATAAVAFTNAGQMKSISLDLVRSSSAGWRIFDIISPSGSLRKLYKIK